MEFERKAVWSQSWIKLNPCDPAEHFRSAGPLRSFSFADTSQTHVLFRNKMFRTLMCRRNDEAPRTFLMYILDKNKPKIPHRGSDCKGDAAGGKRLAAEVGSQGVSSLNLFKLLWVYNVLLIYLDSQCKNTAKYQQSSEIVFIENPIFRFKVTALCVFRT